MLQPSKESRLVSPGGVDGVHIGGFLFSPDQDGRPAAELEMAESCIWFKFTCQLPRPYGVIVTVHDNVTVELNTSMDHMTISVSEDFEVLHHQPHQARLAADARAHVNSCC